MKVKSKFTFILSFVILVSFIIFFFKEKILLQVGDFLLFSEKAKKADVIVILRGSLFERTIQAVELFKQGYGDKILIPMSLDDNISTGFKKFNVILPTGQEKIKSVLKQLNIPEESTILSTNKPGGGTIGEAYRVKKDLLDIGANRFIIVTSWYHTKRVHNIYKKVFSNTNMQFWIVASKFGKSNSKNWWYYRYTAHTVLFEVPRLFISYIDPLFNFSFNDDPLM